MPELDVVKPFTIYQKNVIWITVFAFFLASVAGFYSAIETDTHVTTSTSVYTWQWVMAILLFIFSIAILVLSWFGFRTSGVGGSFMTIIAFGLVIIGFIVGIPGSFLMTFRSNGGIYKNTSGACQPIAGSAVQMSILVTIAIILIMISLEALIGIL